MARSFNGANPDTVQIGNAIVTGFPYSLSCWCNLQSAHSASDMTPFSVTTSQTSTFYTLFIYRGDASGAGGTQSMCAGLNFGTFVQVDPGLNFTLDVWHNLVGIFQSTTIDLYIDGTHYGPTSYTAQTFQSSAHTVIGGVFNGTTAVTFPTYGSIADCAAWNVALTAAEATSLALGARPITIRPSALLGWWPVDGLQSPEPDLSGSAHNGTVTGTALASGPPLMMFTPRWPMGAIMPVTVPPPLNLMPQIVM